MTADHSQAQALGACARSLKQPLIVDRQDQAMTTENQAPEGAELTDEQIGAICKSIVKIRPGEICMQFARAVIAADRAQRAAPAPQAAPEWSPADEAVRWLNEVELAQGGANGPTIKLRAAIMALALEWVEKAQVALEAPAQPRGAQHIWTESVFEGAPPVGFSSWIEWAASPVLCGVAVRATVLADWAAPAAQAPGPG